MMSPTATFDQLT